MSEDLPREQHEERPPTPRCPLCGKPRVPRFRPFCSARCRDVDLGRWFAASYALPADEPGYNEDTDKD
jgi:hypothetical protein